MSMDLDVVVYPTYLHTAVKGVFTLGESKELFASIMAACKSHGLLLALVDTRPLAFPTPPTTYERFNFAVFVADQVAHLHTSRPGRVRVAIVAINDYVDEHRFGETVARNRGASTKVTSDMAEALAWLGVDPADAPRA